MASGLLLASAREVRLQGPPVSWREWCAVPLHTCESVWEAMGVGIFSHSMLPQDV